MHRAASNLYGPGIHEILKSQARQDNIASDLPMEIDDPDAVPMPEHDAGRLMMHLRRKRQATILKHILSSGGYGDLAKMVSFKKED